MLKTVTLEGTPPQLGMQLAENLLTKPIDFAFEQLGREEFELFCSAMLSATAALIAKKVGVHRAAVMTMVLNDVATATAQGHEGRLQ